MSRIPSGGIRRRQQRRMLNLHVPRTATAHRWGRGCWPLVRAKKPRVGLACSESFFCIRGISALSDRERAVGPVSWVKSMLPGECLPRFPAAYEMRFTQRCLPEVRVHGGGGGWPERGNHPPRGLDQPTTGTGCGQLAWPPTRSSGPRSFQARRGRSAMHQVGHGSLDVVAGETRVADCLGRRGRGRNWIVTG